MNDRNQIFEERITARSCRALWCAVLLDNWNTAAKTITRNMTGQTVFDIRTAREWFGSSDFEAVCALIGLDPDPILVKHKARGIDDAR